MKKVVYGTDIIRGICPCCGFPLAEEIESGEKDCIIDYKQNTVGFVYTCPECSHDVEERFKLQYCNSIAYEIEL